MPYIHPTADVQSTTIGEGTEIWQHCVVLPGARIGANCNINAHCLIEGDVSLGNNITVKSGVYLWNGLTVEDDVFIGPNVTFTNDPRPRSKKYPAEFQRTMVRRGASIGAGCTILGGTIVGAFAMVGAGSVVTRNTPAHGLVLGNPAKLGGWVCVCGQTLNADRRCPDCGTETLLSDDDAERLD